MTGGPPSRRPASTVFAATAIPPAIVVALAIREGRGGVTVGQIAIFHVVPAQWLMGTAVVHRQPATVRQNVAIASASLGATLLTAEA